VALDPVEITAGLAIGTGLGGAIEDTVRPRLESFRQSQWQAHPDVALTPGVAAEVTAENYDTFQAMEAEAARNGYNATRFQYLYDVTVTAPGMGELIAMLRRNSEQAIDFTHGLRKAKLETRWDAALANLANQRLSAPDIAYMVVRGVLPDDGMLGQSLPTRADNLNLPPQIALDPIAEAALTGWDKERLRAFIGRSGLAMAPVMAAQARFRGILTQNDYELTIARGDLYPAYAHPVLEASRQIPTTDQFVEAHLRGWITAQEMYAGTALHGMTQPNTDLQYHIHRRPLSPHQIKQALARGASFNPEQGEITDPYTASVHQANLGPEWYEMAVSLQGSYPSLFITNRLVTQGTISADTGRTWLERSGLADTVVTSMHDFWTSGTGTTADPHVTKAENQLWTTAHKSYVGEMIDSATATTALGAAGVSAGAISAVLSRWNEERSLIRKQLSPAQIKKALKDGLYTQTQAVDALLARGYDQADATILLEE
jgi:hypothetical protein